MRDLTYGEKIVRKSFNPSERPEVKEAKRLCAELIDFVQTFSPDSPDELSLEENRLFSKANESFEEGCMWLVKALTVRL